MTELRIETAVPSPGDPDRPLVLLLHGYNSSETDLAGLFDYLPSEYRYVSLRAPLQREYGWAWFALERDADGFVLGNVGDGRDAVIDWCREHNEAPVGAIGFSQGGALALELLRAGVIDWAGVLSGFIAPSEDAQSAQVDAQLAARKPAVFWGHGLEDPQISAELVERLRAWLDEHSDATVKHYSGLAHSINAAELNDLGDWLRARPGRA